MQKRFAAGFAGDFILVTASYALCIGLKPGISSYNYYHSYALSFIFFLIIWIVVSFTLEKYNFNIITNWGILVKKILISNLFIFFIITSMMYLFQTFNYSRFIVLGTVGITTLAELSLGSVYYLFLHTRVKYEDGNAGAESLGSFTQGISKGSSSSCPQERSQI